MRRNHTLYILLLCILLFTLSRCVKTPIVPDGGGGDGFVDTDVQFLGHKGAGSNNYNDVNMENTVPSIQQALLTMDGIECDLQMSLDGTIWLFHDEDVSTFECVPRTSRSIINMHDAEIESLELCSRTKTGRVYRLSEVRDIWNSTPNGFYISFEIKEYFSTAQYNLAGGKTYYFNRFADVFAATMTGLTHTGKKFYIEVSQKSVCDRLKTYPVANYLIICMGEYAPFAQVVADARAQGFDGVSCSFADNTITAQGIKNAQDDGLVVQIWTPDTYNELASVFNMHPTTIQTDNISIKNDLHVR
jgi:glycerophosphoryl diester phosphodiesterase